MTKKTRNSEEILAEMGRLFQDVEGEARLKGGYWQGKKDGLRIARIYMLELLGEDERAKSLLDWHLSSPGGEATDKQSLAGLANCLYHCVDEMLWMDRVGEPMHPMSRINMIQAWDYYHQLAHQELVKPDESPLYDRFHKLKTPGRNKENG